MKKIRVWVSRDNPDKGYLADTWRKKPTDDDGYFGYSANDEVGGYLESIFHRLIRPGECLAFDLVPVKSKGGKK